MITYHLVPHRTLQEIKTYETEQGQQEAKIAKMKEDGVDEYDVRKQEEVLAETVMMIPERRTALESAVQDLTDLLVRRRPAAPRECSLGQTESQCIELTARRKRKKLSPLASARRLLRRRISLVLLQRRLGRETICATFKHVSFVTQTLTHYSPRPGWSRTRGLGPLQLLHASLLCCLSRRSHREAAADPCQG